MTAQSTFRIAFWILLAGVLFLRIYFTLRVRRAGERFMPDCEAVKSEGRGMFAARVILFLLLIAWLILYTLNPAWVGALAVPLPDWLRLMGFALELASLGFLAWAQVALGKEWSPQLQLREKHLLVTNGPYARMRHPLYTAMIGYSTGIALVTSNWAFIGLAVVAIAGLTFRVPREEQMMLNEFGEEYRAYMRRTGRFFPR
jgi:protein-S-isoprenylcysteine O-methyltransferase Ste14